MASFDIKDIDRKRAEYSAQTAIDANEAAHLIGRFPPLEYPSKFNTEKWSPIARILWRQSIRTPTVVKNDIDFNEYTDSESDIDIPGYVLPGDKPKSVRQMLAPVNNRSSPVIDSAECMASCSLEVVAGGDDGDKRKRNHDRDGNGFSIDHCAPPSKKKKVTIIMRVNGAIPPVTQELLRRRQGRQVTSRVNIVLSVNGNVPELTRLLRRRRGRQVTNRANIVLSVNGNVPELTQMLLRQRRERGSN